MMARVRRVCIGLAFVFGVWWLFSLIYAPYVPRPTAVAACLLSLESKTLFRPTLITVGVVSLCLVASLASGYAAGCAIGLSAGAKSILYFPASVFKSVPVSVFLPVFIVIFHLDYFVYPMLWLPVWAMVTVNIANSVLEMPRERVVQRRLLELRVWPYLRDIVFWETLDSLFATVRIAAPFCLTLQVALDYFLDVNDGLGAFIKTSNEGLQYVQMHAGALVVCFLGFGLLVGTDELSARLQKWRIKTLN